MSVTLLVVIGCAIVGSVLALRAARRRLHQLRRRWLLAPLTTAPRLLGHVARTPAASPTWWSAQLERRRLWRSVTAAEQAVATATSAAVPVGDLPSLTRRLRRAAQSVDRTLVAASRSGTGAPAFVRIRVREVRDNADRIYAAAMESLATTAHGETSHLTRAVQIEVEALRAGLVTGGWR